jgi:eukaryotic-like serine/threonine-protein kinase
MGTLWVADHLVLARPVAVKFMAHELDHPDALARFQREATATARIRSPHVVQIFDLGAASDGTPYMAMELLEGETLAARIDRDGALGMHVAADLIFQLGRALGAAHKAGIVHRDIKPDNVFLQRNDDSVFVKVVDFGVAKTESPKVGPRVNTSAGVALGSPVYMSPEQMIDAGGVDFRADLWAAAVCAYEMLTGQVPFQGESYPSVCAAVLGGAYLPPSELCDAALPPGVDEWFARAFHQMPTQRFDSARELALSFVALLPEHDIEDPFSESGRYFLSQSGQFSSASLIDSPLESPSERPSAEIEVRDEDGSSPEIIVGDTSSAPPKAEPPAAPAARVPFREPAHRRHRYAPGLVLVSAGALALGVAGAVVFRGRLWPASHVVATASPSPPHPTHAPIASIEPEVTATATAPVPTATAVPTAAASVAATPQEIASTWRERVARPIGLSRWDDAVTGLAEVARMDPGIAGRDAYQTHVLDLAVKAVLNGGEAERRMLALLSGELGEHGIDLLYEIVVRWGGSRAADRAASLLQDAAVRDRGSAAMRVAYELRTAASCAAKRALLDRVATDGDYRALRELKGIAANECPDLTRDVAYVKARSAVVDRLHR